MIGSYSFYQCTQLESVDLSKCSSLTTIGSFSFALCSSLTHFNFSPSIETIASNAFRSVPLEQTLDITKITHLSVDAFPNTSLSFTCEDSHPTCREYEGNIYRDSYKLLSIVSYSTTSLKLHENTNGLGWCAFSTSSLQEVILPSQINFLQQCVFHLNDHIKKIIFSPNIKNINSPDAVVFTLPNLEVVYFPEGIEKVSTLTITTCPNLKFIHFPNSLNTVSRDVFKVPSISHVTYNASQFSMLLRGGIPLHALLHHHTKNYQTHFFNHFPVFIFSLLFYI